MNRLTGRETAAEIIRYAAETVDLYDVLAEEFDLHPPREARSFKGSCPFGFEHDDGGLVKAFRTYGGGNTAYCFNGHGFYDPVRLIAQSREWSNLRAAKWLLERRGLMAPMGYRERFIALEKASLAPRPAGDPAYAVEALQMALRAHEGYVRLQYHPVLAEALNRAMQALNAILEAKHGDPAPALRSWFESATTQITRLLDKLTEVTHDGEQTPEQEKPRAQD